MRRKQELQLGGSRLGGDLHLPIRNPVFRVSPSCSVTTLTSAGTRSEPNGSGVRVGIFSFTSPVPAVCRPASSVQPTLLAASPYL
jgi:hypothetical protein